MKKLSKIIVFFAIALVLLYGTYIGAKIVYPIKYAKTIYKYSEEFEIDPFIVTSMIKAESNFDEGVISHKGATGLMQITEGTAEWIAQKLNIENFDYERDAKDPEINIKMGTFYIAYLFKMYEKRADCAIAAYNAGFNNVDRWLLSEEYSKNGKILDKIPFQETQRYLNKVRNNYRIYKILYKEFTY